MYAHTCATCARPIQEGQMTTYIKGEICHMNIVDCFALRGIYVPGYSVEQIKQNLANRYKEAPCKG